MTRYEFIQEEQENCSSGNTRRSQINRSPLKAWGGLYLWVRSAKGEVQPESKLEVHGLEDEERFLADAHWSGDESQSSVNEAFTGHQRLSF